MFYRKITQIYCQILEKVLNAVLFTLMLGGFRFELATDRWSLWKRWELGECSIFKIDIEFLLMEVMKEG